jgi:hypothetical protein
MAMFITLGTTWFLKKENLSEKNMRNVDAIHQVLAHCGLAARNLKRPYRGH